MAILIENLPVPYNNDGLLELRVFNGQPQARYNDGYGGCSKWQNMIDVPPHGRLIDSDALEELFREVIGSIAKRKEMEPVLEHMVRASAMVVEMIDDAPTIIPAEGSET